MKIFSFKKSCFNAHDFKFAYIPDSMEVGAHELIITFKSEGELGIRFISNEHAMKALEDLKEFLKEVNVNGQ